MMVYMDFQMRQTQFLNSQKLPAKSTSDHFGSFTFSLLRIFLFLRFFFNQRLLKDSSVLFWLVVLGLTALIDSILVYIGPSPREREKEERNDRREKTVQTTPPESTARAAGPCPILIQTSRTPWHWKFIQHHSTTRPPHGMLDSRVLMLKDRGRCGAL